MIERKGVQPASRHLIRRLSSCVVLLSLAACSASAATEDAETATDALSGCSKGRQLAKQLPELGIQAGIVDSANRESLASLRPFMDIDALENLDEVRSRGPFNSFVELACVPRLGARALKDIAIISMAACGGRSGPAPVDPASGRQDAIARTCGFWSTSCGNERLRPTDPVQPACDSPTPRGTFVRRVATNEAPFAALPKEIRFEDGRYSAIYPDGRSVQGRAQQKERQHGSTGRFAYVELNDDETGAVDTVFSMTVDADGANLRLEPLVGPVGRDVEAPTFERQAESD